MAKTAILSALLLTIRAIISAIKNIAMNSTKYFFIILSFRMGRFFYYQAIRFYLNFMSEFQFETNDYLIIKF
jgi:hypothetical protein